MSDGNEPEIRNGLSRRRLFQLGMGAIASAQIATTQNADAETPGALTGGASVPESSLKPKERMDNNNVTLWYDRPAEAWTEALPVGNGRLGAMHFGGVAAEQLQLNEHTLWAGGPHDYDHPCAAEVMPEIRRLIFEGRYREAQELADQKVMSLPIGQAPYQTLGDVRLDFGDATFSNYRRELDLDSAVSSVTYESGGVRYKRELFASYPDQILVLRLTGDRPGAVSFKARLDSPQKSTARTTERQIWLEGISSDFESIPGAVRFAALADIEATGGSLVPNGPGIEVKAADSATIRIAMATSYKSYDDVSGDPSALVEACVAKARDTHLAALRSKHIEDHRRLFRGVTLDFLESHPAATTDRRILNFAKGDDPTLPALYFQYGRYLMIASSRPGGAPGNLQGIWNDSLNPPWGSKYTININTEMNYWPVETAGLSECHEPLFAMIADIAKTGEKTAQVTYGAPGWVTHHNTDGWRGAAPIDGASWGLWPMGGAWLSTHLWEHYAFHGDLEKLKSHYPIIKGATEFQLATLQAHPTKGWLVTNPSTSPENQHPHGSGLCAGATMDLQILRDLFAQFIDASQVLNVDEDLRARVREAREKLAPMQIGHAGQLQEWLDDWDMDAPEIHHRHVSHMYGVFPSSQITPGSTPELANAARRSLEIRGDEGTGWSLAWKINLWARLHDGNHAFRLICDALRPQGHQGGGVYPNLFDAHPPFQIDGNFGFTSGVIEMLLQSHHGMLQLLPALPSAWPKGHVRGLCARGGIKVDLEWDKGTLKHALLEAARWTQIPVHSGDRQVNVTLEPGKRVRLNSDLAVV